MLNGADFAGTPAAIFIERPNQEETMLLATDLDGTFLAGDPDSRLKLYQLVVSHPEIQLVFVTGRGLESANLRFL